MPTTAADEDLAEGLRDARKSPRNFALIAKGPAPVKLIVQKKPIRDGDVIKAKTEFKGNLAIQGVVLVDGGEFEFQVVGEEPALKPSKLKEFISEQADMTVKVRWSVVTTLASVDESDGKGGETPPLAPPQGGTTADDAARQKLIDALKAIAPKMQQAIAAKPPRSGEVLAAAGQVKTLIGENKIPEATTAFGALTSLIKELLGAGQTDEQADDQVQDEEDYALDSLFPDTDEDDQGDADATAETEDDIPVPPPMPTLSEEEAKQPVPEPPAAKAPGVGGRLRWQDAKEEVDVNLSKLTAILREQDDPDLKSIAEFGFNGITGKLQVGLRVALMEFDRAGKEDREKCRKKALDIIQQYQEFLQTNALIKLVDENDFGVTIDARRILGDALKELQSSLKA